MPKFQVKIGGHPRSLNQGDHTSKDVILIDVFPDMNNLLSDFAVGAGIQICSEVFGDLPLPDSIALCFVNRLAIQKFSYASNNFKAHPLENEKFYTQALDEKTYRIVLNYFLDDEKLASQAFIALKDFATLREFGRHVPARLLQQSQELIFEKSNSFMYAFSYGATLFSYNKKRSRMGEPVFLKEYDFQIESSKYSYKIKLDYTPQKILPSRIIAFSGPNASGKSYSLEKIITSILSGQAWKQAGFACNKVIVISNTISDSYAKTRRALSNIAPSGNYYSYANMISLKRFDTDSGFREGVKTSWDLKSMILRDALETSHFEKLSLLIQALRICIRFDEIEIPEYGGIYSYLSDWRMKSALESAMSRIDYSKDVRFVYKDEVVNLSSGQWSFVRFVFFALSNIERNSFVVYDEPENFLHPTLEVEFVKIFLKLLDDSESIGIIATHSATILREIPSSLIRIFYRSDTEIINCPPNIETFGNNLQKISDYAFGDTTTPKNYIGYLPAIAGNSKNIDEFIEANTGQFDTSIISLVANKYFRRK